MHNQLKWGPIAAIVVAVGMISLITLWQYRELVGLTFLGLLVAGTVVALRNNLNEQQIRQQRFSPQNEEPLPQAAQPPYLREPLSYSGPAVYDDGAQLPLYDQQQSRYHPQGDFYQHEPEEVRD